MQRSQLLVADKRSVTAIHWFDKRQAHTQRTDALQHNVSYSEYCPDCVDEW